MEIGFIASVIRRSLPASMRSNDTLIIINKSNYHVCVTYIYDPASPATSAKSAAQSSTNGMQGRVRVRVRVRVGVRASHHSCDLRCCNRAQRLATTASSRKGATIFTVTRSPTAAPPSPPSLVPNPAEPAEPAVVVDSMESSTVGRGGACARVDSRLVGWKAAIKMPLCVFVSLCPPALLGTAGSLGERVVPKGD